MKTDPDVRFWSKVAKGDGCWTWTGGRDVNGYGVFYDWNHKPWRAHRYMWAIERGSIGGMCVCHRCDNPECVNPDHLFLGTHTDNMRDMTAKGRGNRPNTQGSRHGAAKLSEQDVLDIRGDLAEGIAGTSIAYRYGVSRQLVSQIRTRAKWRHV